MNLADLTGKPIAEFARDRGFALLDALVAALVLTVLAYIYKRMSKTTFLVRYSLRTKLTAAMGTLALPVAMGYLLNAQAGVLLVSAFVGFGLVIQWLLRDVSKVGITNAFETTKQGVSAEASLKEVRRNMVFLGIGGKKLTDLPEFDEMLKRCRSAGGSVKFLLSQPENEALEDLAKQNNHDDRSYRSRVKESIREIYTRATTVGVPFEIRLYDLKQKIALPHFRLMFIDDHLCIFSQVFWSRSEGLDNPQLILRAHRDRAESSLYNGYRSYFEDLWNLDTTQKVDAAMLAGWPA